MKRNEEYIYKFEDPKQYLFGDELGFVDEYKRDVVHRGEVKQIFRQLLAPIIKNYQTL